MSDLKKPSDRFREMAEKIDRNEAADFAGAFLVIPPMGEPISGLLVGDSDVASFFGMLKTKLDTAVDALDTKIAHEKAYGRRG